jgi:hypothetical protein
MDFRKLGLALDAMGADYTFGEALDLIHELQRDGRSHLLAELRGWEFVASEADVAAILHATRILNLHRGENAAPIHLPLPWSDVDDVSPEERAEYEAQLERRSAFAS